MVRQIKVLCMVAIMFVIPCRTIASAGNTDDENLHHCLGATGELTSGTTWQLEASYHWFPIRYVGIGASVGFWKQIGNDYIPSAKGWRVREDSQNVMNGFVMPSLILQTPALVKTEDLSVGLMAEPGMMFNIPYDKVYIEYTNDKGIPIADNKISYHDSSWLALNLRIGIYSKFDRISLTLGYVFTNLDVYAMRRNMQYDNVKLGDFYPKRKYHGGAFLRVSCLL